MKLQYVRLYVHAQMSFYSLTYQEKQLSSEILIRVYLFQYSLKYLIAD